MMNKPQIGAALLALSSCCPADAWAPLTSQCKESELTRPVPTVNISRSASSPAFFGKPEKPVTQRKRKYRIPVPNPVIDVQQELWDCIFELKPHLMMECIDQTISSGNCYNEGVNGIIDGNAGIRECRDAKEYRYNGDSPAKIKKAMTKEAQCLSVVMDSSPDVLHPLDTCFNEELSCLREQIRNNSLVCTEEEQEIRYGI